MSRTAEQERADVVALLERLSRIAAGVRNAAAVNAYAEALKIVKRGDHVGGADVRWDERPPSARGKRVRP